MARDQSVEDVYEAIRESDRWDHLRQPGHKLIKGRGQTDGPLAMVVGEAPNATDTSKGKPFSGPNGKLLAQLMGLAGLYAEDWQDEGRREYGVANAFITTVVKYRPPGSRKPTLIEQLDGAEDLRREWAALGKPKLIVAVGAVARDVLAPTSKPYPGEWVSLADGETTLWVQYHPQYGILHPESQDSMEEHWEAMGEWARLSGLC